MAAPPTVTASLSASQGGAPFEVSIDLILDGAFTGAADITVKDGDREVATARVDAARPSGTVITVSDARAPINAPVTYSVTSVYDAGGESTKQSTVEYRARMFCAANGDTGAVGVGNPSQSVSVSRPQRSLVYFEGRPLPVLYDGTAVGMTVSLGFITSDAECVRSWLALSEDGRPCVVKTMDGMVIDAAVDAQADLFPGTPVAWNVGVTATRIG